MNRKRLYRNSSNEVLGGVASGIADYFETDPIIIRIFFILATIFGGWGLIIYIIFWIAVPKDNSAQFTSRAEEKESSSHFEQQEKYSPVTDTDMERRKKGSLIGGTILIIIGTLFILERFIPRLSFNDIWPFFLVILGVIILFTGFINISKDER